MSSTLVGRDRELDELGTALEQAQRGHGRLVLIGGEPGIGKSRLADEIAGHARDAGAVVLWGRGWEDAGAPPYWPWVQILRSYVRGAELDAVKKELGHGASQVVQMLPELHDFMPELPPARPTESDSARFQLFDSTATFLRNAAASRPILAVVDDLQAADTPSILFLQFLASQLSEMSLLVIGTYRDVALTPDHPLTTALVELTREPATRLLTLPGLDLGSLSTFINAETGVAPDARAVAAVWRETKGNPLFVREAVRLLSAEGRLDAGAELPSLRVEVPAGVRDVIARRIGHLSEVGEHALALGAVLGPEFSLEMLRAIDGSGSDEVLDAIDDATTAGLLVAVTSAPGRFRFSHDLVRETLHDDLSPGRRARLHRQVAQVLEQQYAADPEPHLAELAFHYYEAASSDPSLAGKAIDYATRAGRRASFALAYEEAARHFRMGLALVELADEPMDARRIDLLLSLGDVQARAGDLSSREIFVQAADLARRSGTPQQLARASLGIGGRLPWSRAGNDTQVIPSLQDALVLLGGADDRLRVKLLGRLACALRSSPDQRDQSAALSGQAVELARSLDDPATLSYALAARYWATWWPENMAERLPMAEEMVEVAAAAGDAERMVDAQLMHWIAYSEIGQMAEARRKLPEVIRVARNVRGLTPWQLWLDLAPVSQAALIDGDYALASELLAREASSGPMTTARDDISAWRMQTFLLAREQGTCAAVEGQVRSAVEEFPWYPCHRAALALLLHDLGRRDEARAVFDDLAQDRFGALYHDNEWLLGIAMASEACALLEDADRAEVLYEQLAPFSGSHAIGHAEGSVGATDRYLGLLAATLGRVDDAVTHLEAGLQMNEKMGSPPWAAHTQVDLARTLRSRRGPGDVKRAEQLERAALRTARVLGMTVLEGRLATPDSAATAAEAPSAEAQRTSAGRFRREGDYWTVVYEGSTVRVRDAKGMRYLARLLADPGREFHAIDLVADGTAAVTVGVRHEPSVSIGDGGDAGVRLDAEATAAYLARLHELQEDAAEADAWNDPDRADRAQQEIAFLTDELKAAVGLGGRDRRLASAAERARLSVTRAIRGAMARIAEQHPALGRHLEVTVRTGTFCSYQPDPRVAMAWEL